jgi:hypothetical protein
LSLSDGIERRFVAHRAQSQLPVVFAGSRNAALPPAQPLTPRSLLPTSQPLNAVSWDFIAELVAIVFGPQHPDLEPQHFSPTTLPPATVESARFEAQTALDWVGQVAVFESKEVGLRHSIVTVGQDSFAVADFGTKFADKVRILRWFL